jgi:hypothetical protein
MLVHNNYIEEFGATRASTCREFFKSLSDNDLQQFRKAIFRSGTTLAIEGCRIKETVKVVWTDRFLREEINPEVRHV